MNNTKTSLSLGSAFLASATLALSAHAGQAGFTSQTLNKGYQVAAADMARMENDGASAPMEPKHADGKCGADKARDGSCGASKPHAGKKRADGKCGEGKCGASKARAAKKASAPASGM